jgi:hypothetical protein
MNARSGRVGNASYWHRNNAVKFMETLELVLDFAANAVPLHASSSESAP